MKTYHPTKIKPLVKLIARVIKEEPDLIDDIENMMVSLRQKVPGFKDNEKCICCGAGMEEYNYKFDTMDAVLLIEMAYRLKVQLGLGNVFNEANKIKISNLRPIASIKNRTTHCSKLGLIAKLQSKSGKQVSGTWVITRRGFAALRGDPVPYIVTVFRGAIIERDSSNVTIGGIFNHYKKNRRKRDAAIDLVISEYAEDDYTSLAFHYAKYNKPEENEI